MQSEKESKLKIDVNKPLTEEQKAKLQQGLAQYHIVLARKLTEHAKPVKKEAKPKTQFGRSVHRKLNDITFQHVWGR